MTARRAVVAAVLAASIGWAGRAFGEPIDVEIHQCEWRRDELARLVRLELASVLVASGPTAVYRVAITCMPQGVRIQLDDPLTGKRLERVVTAPPLDQPEPERLLALTVAQLYRASWLELVAEDEPPLPAADPALPREDALATAREAVLPTVQPSRPTDRPWSVGLGGGVQIRRLQAPLVLPRVEAQVAWWPSRRVWLFVSGGGEWASPSRTTGTVETLVLRGAAGVGVEPLVRGAWSAFAEIESGAAYARFEGTDVPDGYATDTIAGAGFDASVALGAGLTVEPIRIELLGRLGVLAWTPVAIVDGDDDVALDGAWTGALLRMRWAP